MRQIKLLARPRPCPVPSTHILAVTDHSSNQPCAQRFGACTTPPTPLLGPNTPSNVYIRSISSCAALYPSTALVYDPVESSLGAVPSSSKSDSAPTVAGVGSDLAVQALGDFRVGSPRASPNYLSLLGREDWRWVVHTVVKVEEWWTADIALRKMYALPNHGATDGLDTELKVELMRFALEACVRGRRRNHTVYNAGHLSTKLIRWLDELSLDHLSPQDYGHAILAVSASSSLHHSAKKILDKAIKRGFRPATGHYLAVMECMTAAREWEGIARVFESVVDIAAEQVPSHGLLRAALPGLVWEWEPAKLILVAVHAVEWSAMNLGDRERKGKEMMEDLISAYAAAGQLPRISEGAERPLQGCLEVMLHWEGWLGRRTITEGAFCQVMEILNSRGQFAGTLSLLDAIKSNVVAGVAPPGPEAFALALLACAGKALAEGSLPDETPKSIVLFMQACKVEPNAAVYAARITCCKRNEGEAMKLLDEMQREGHPPTTSAVNAAMVVCINANKYKMALVAHKKLDEADWDGRTVQLMNICHARMGGRGALVQVVQRLQERERDGNRLALPDAKDYLRLAKACVSAGGQRRKAWEVLLLCRAAQVKPSEELLLVVAKACLEMNMGKETYKCLMWGLGHHVGKETGEELAHLALEAAAACRLWDSLKKVRLLMASWDVPVRQDVMDRILAIENDGGGEGRWKSEEEPKNERKGDKDRAGRAPIPQSHPRSPPPVRNHANRKQGRQEGQSKGRAWAHPHSPKPVRNDADRKRGGQEGRGKGQGHGWRTTRQDRSMRTENREWSSNRRGSSPPCRLRWDSQGPAPLSSPSASWWRGDEPREGLLGVMGYLEEKASSVPRKKGDFEARRGLAGIQDRGIRHSNIKQGEGEDRGRLRDATDLGERKLDDVRGSGGEGEKSGGWGEWEEEV